MSGHPGKSICVWLAACWTAAFMACLNSHAQAPGNSPAPPFPSVKSPVDTFRELLAMDPQQLADALQQRQPASRSAILQKLREYKALDADERELRLRATELRWYLLPILESPGTNRESQLQGVPAGVRKLIESRLATWDITPPEIQRVWLTNYSAALRVLEMQKQRSSAANLSAAQRQAMEADLQKWQAMPEDQRMNIVGSVDQFLTLTPRERNLTLKEFSDPERQQIEKTLQDFAGLTPQQRAQCVRSFQRFAGLPQAERVQFLKNAERWQAMTKAERQTWRDLVRKQADLPPLPPGLDLPGLPMPPNVVSRPPKPLVTNGN